MAYIRIKIPTGYRTVTSFASKTNAISYQCCSCGKKVIAPFVVHSEGMVTYHVRQSAAVKEQAKQNAEILAKRELQQTDARIFNKINVEHDYKKMDRKVACPYCNAVQPWSDLPKEWKQTNIHEIWGIFIWLSVVWLCFSLLMLSDSIEIGSIICFAIALIAVAACALIPVAVNINRKKALEKLKDTVFEAPVYYNSENWNELVEQPCAMQDIEQ